MAMHVLENEILKIAVADAGAELSSVYDKENGLERLWGADPTVWNRHAPILFPFVGRVYDKTYRVNGREYSMKTQHGFARDLDFRCTEETAESLCQVLTSTEATKVIYPWDFRLQIRHRLDAANPRLLHVEWDVSNTGEGTMVYSIGGHPGFLMPAGVQKEDCRIAFPGREEIEIFGNESAFDAICRHYLHWNQCARFMDGMKIDQRTTEVQRLVKEFAADGVIYENMKFCEFWSYEKVLKSHIFINDLHIPTCTIEKEYVLGAMGQLRTRFQAFIESLEIKQIQGGK